MSVTVVDESQYAAATQGTLPLIVVATATNKTDASGSAIASGTLEQNVRVAYLVSSQRELVETFESPNSTKLADRLCKEQKLVNMVF